jgi:hypothetical protein
MNRVKRVSTNVMRAIKYTIVKRTQPYLLPKKPEMPQMHDMPDMPDINDSGLVWAEYGMKMKECDRIKFEMDITKHIN